MVAVSSRVPGSPYNALNFRGEVFAGWYRFGYPAVYWTLNPLEGRSPYCWHIAGGDGVVLEREQDVQPTHKQDHYFQLVRAHPVAKAIFYERVISNFREV